MLGLCFFVSREAHCAPPPPQWARPRASGGMSSNWFSVLFAGHLCSRGTRECVIVILIMLLWSVLPPCEVPYPRQRSRLRAPSGINLNLYSSLFVNHLCSRGTRELVMIIMLLLLVLSPCEAPCRAVLIWTSVVPCSLPTFSRGTKVGVIIRIMLLTLNPIHMWL